MQKMEGLGMLPLITRISPQKILSQIKARELASGIEVTGYQIRHGRSKTTVNLRPIFEVFQAKDRRVKKYDGVMARDRRCWGTYIHGVFDSDAFRRHFINGARRRKGWKKLPIISNYDVDKEIDKLAHLIRRNVDLISVYKILIKGRGA
jgi:adenosylcobyric acid synthase